MVDTYWIWTRGHELPMEHSIGVASENQLKTATQSHPRHSCIHELVLPLFREPRSSWRVNKRTVIELHWTTWVPPRTTSLNYLIDLPELRDKNLEFSTNSEVQQLIRLKKRAVENIYNISTVFSCFSAYSFVFSFHVRFGHSPARTRLWLRNANKLGSINWCIGLIIDIQWLFENRVDRMVEVLAEISDEFSPFGVYVGRRFPLCVVLFASAFVGERTMNNRQFFDRVLETRKNF